MYNNQLATFSEGLFKIMWNVSEHLTELFKHAKYKNQIS